MVVHGTGRPVQWLDAAATRRWWTHAGTHVAVPGEHGAEPDRDGRSWGARLWRRGQERLLAFTTFC